MKKQLMISALLLLSSFCHGQDGIGVFAGAHGGLYSPSIPRYHSVYPNDVLPFGFQAGVGHDWFYLTGKFRSFTAHGQPEIYSTIATSGSMESTLSQSMHYYGMRLYKYGNNLNFYTDVGYCRIRTEEDIVATDATFQNFERNTRFRSSGLGLTLGMEKPLFKYVAIDAQLEWTQVIHRQAPTGIVGGSPKVGGVLIGLGLNVKISR